MRNTFFLFMIALVVACAEPPITPDEVGDAVQWGEAKNVHQLRHLWIADQPDAVGLDAAKAAGVELVIDLRAPGERDWDEKTAVEERGLAYYNVPVVGTEPFSEQAFSEIERIIKEHSGQQTLIHCSSGNRAAAWLTAHLARAHEMPFGVALEAGKRAGITKGVIVRKVAAFLGETAPAADPS